MNLNNSFTQFGSQKAQFPKVLCTSLLSLIREFSTKNKEQKIFKLWLLPEVFSSCFLNSVPDYTSWWLPNFLFAHKT
ncbi:MAG TPA: hypothetical protein DEG17_25380 [Cyanobacteria bacterium UBA11149]|nr:hypothetical protein [Cyanobacteria bacterium UBA11366]HBR73406.1 hypothetical protein [Cyanobacteria bacterium UBA11159]HBW92109.1 hypothetical protein [Cyanobacteria bacterium UBA11149]HCA97346.1 hypothetical protein [Cyanobacteria bacterium UBA9226]